jgi:hypothetical protein
VLERLRRREYLLCSGGFLFQRADKAVDRPWRDEVGEEQQIVHQPLCSDTHDPSKPCWLSYREEGPARLADSSTSARQDRGLQQVHPLVLGFLKHGVDPAPISPLVELARIVGKVKEPNQ